MAPVTGMVATRGGCSIGPAALCKIPKLQICDLRSFAAWLYVDAELAMKNKTQVRAHRPPPTRTNLGEKSQKSVAAPINSHFPERIDRQTPTDF